VLYLRLIILSVRGDIPVDSDAFFMTDIVNLKIKPAQSFIVAHRGRMCVHVFIEMSIRTCINIYIYTVFLKKKVLETNEPSRNKLPSRCLASLG
jgi:hypothetical protein